MDRWAVGLVALAFTLMVLPTPIGPIAHGSNVRPAGGTDGVYPMVAMGHAAPSTGESCSRYALCPSMVRTAYNFTHLLKSAASNGTGQSIVIVDACGDPHVARDLVTFDTVNHLPVASLTVTSYGGGTGCRKDAWSTETSLDVEWVHALAPGAKIQLIVTTNPKDQTMYGAWNYSLTNHLGNPISNSWGGHGGCTRRISAVLANATSAGVTVLASAGDSGAWGAGTGQRAQNPADCPSVLTVGGTSLHVGAKGAYSSETGWYGSGGGYVGGRHEPGYQVNASITDPYKVLGKPDVSAVADPSTGVWVYNSNQGGWYVVGGTSVACPIWAAFVADVNTQRAANAFAPLGSVDAYLYADVYGVAGAGTNYSVEFHDVTSGNNGWPAATGWDPVSGLGSLNAGPMAQQLASDPLA
ncbi:MAG TPA: S53 family peptidase [Thermoplasmata archaeon]|nr:S53 family peptidase [Thermoplasmata archaeon]